MSTQRSGRAGAGGEEPRARDTSYFPFDVATDPRRAARMDGALVLYVLLWQNIIDPEEETGEIDLATVAAQLRRPYQDIWSLAQRLEALGEVRFSPVLRLQDQQHSVYQFQIARPVGNDARRSLGRFLREERGEHTV